MMTMYDVPDYNLNPPEPHRDDCYCDDCHEFHAVSDWTVLPECPACLGYLEQWAGEIAADAEIDAASDDNELDMEADLDGQ